MRTLAEIYKDQQDLKDKLEIVQALVTYFTGKLNDKSVSKLEREAITEMLKDFVNGISGTEKE